ncbi:hypothetical protein [Pseudomonas urmiensis]|uniref:hypothetical protein n=1 Tax=Pseudomonas urmiensis TaxID=2745493 RepID=UPI003C851F25
MTDRTYEILKAKYAPHLVNDVPVQAFPVSMEEFALQIQKSYLEAAGLNPADRHAWADRIVAMKANQELEQLLRMKMQFGINKHD